MKMANVGKPVRAGVLLTLSMFVLLVLVMTHASPALSQETSTVRVSNLGVEVESQIGMDNGQMNAHSFHTGDTAVTLEKVRMYARTVRPDPPPVVTIRADDSGQPGSTLLTLTTPTFGKSTGPIPLDFTTTGFQLAADTTYWVVVRRPWNNDFCTGHFIFTVASSGSGSTGETGWSLGETIFYASGSNWYRQMKYSMRMAVYASPNSQEQAANTPATGEPGISGTARVGETLTATTSGIEDEDGMTGAVFAYQWVRHDLTSATDTDIEGATGSTYTVTEADSGKAIKVRVTFTDDAANEESLTSNAVAASPPLAIPLTATIHDGPESHDGSAVTFELRFSETPADGFSYTTVRDHAFTVTGGSLTNVRRLVPGKNVRWEITVTPDSDADLTLALNATTDCSTEGAICNADGGKLSGGLEIVVPGPPSNSAATGAPTIGGTAQVGETLIASTSGISDADGLANASFAYQWLADDAEISGATGSSYTLADADVGKAIKVTVSFTDDAGNAETLTSVATTAVAGPPLTATVHGQPSSHDGIAAFTFELRFSETPVASFSYKTLQNRALTVTGGTLPKVRRLEPGKNVRWEITVQPSSNADVTIVLPITTDCTAQSAICTGDGRPLSDRVEVTASGPGG